MFAFSDCNITCTSDIYYPAMDLPDEDLFSLPLPTVNGIPGRTALMCLQRSMRHYHAKEWFQKEFQLQPEMVEYLIAVVDSFDFEDRNQMVKHSAFLLMKKFFFSMVQRLQPPNFDNLQVYVLGAVLIATRFHVSRELPEGSRITVSRLHELSAHAFNSGQLIGAQVEILDAVAFDIPGSLHGGSLVPQWIDLIMTLCGELVAPPHSEILRRICGHLLDLLLTHEELFFRYNPDEIALGIFYYAVRIVTRAQSYPPPVRRAASLLLLSMEEVLKIGAALHSSFFAHSQTQAGPRFDVSTSHSSSFG